MPVVDNNEVYEMEKREGRGLSPDDDTRKTGNVEDEEKYTNKKGDNVAVVMELAPIVATDSNQFNGVFHPQVSIYLLWSHI